MSMETHLAWAFLKVASKYFAVDEILKLELRVVLSALFFCSKLLPLPATGAVMDISSTWNPV